MTQKRFWYQLYFGCNAGATTVNRVDVPGRNITIEGFGGATVADVVYLYAHLHAHLLNGTDIYLLPTNPTAGAWNDTAVACPDLTEYLHTRPELTTSPIDVCQVDYLNVVLNNGSAANDNFAGHLRGFAWE